MAEEKPAKEEEYFGYDLYPQRDPKNPARESVSSKLLLLNLRCRSMLQIAMNQNPQTKTLLQAMEQSGCRVFKDRHFSCEDCKPRIGGGFDPATSQVVLCQNNIGNQTQMNMTIKHEMIHAFDYCRASVDFFRNIRHLACSEIRASNLSGECSLGVEMQRLKFGLKSHHRACVRGRAIMSLLSTRNISQELAEKAVDEVFDSCFNDLEPYGRIPYNKVSANMSYREYMNRARYYANI